jgi:asparagine synthase (glutamine-hydrolysing)
MKKNNSILPLTSLQYYLTIRYFPKEKSIITPITAKNFQDKYSDPNGIKTEKILKEIIKKTLTNQSGSCVISLSGGIDSTLCLGLVRNVFPKKKITGICAIFENAFDESKAAKKVADKFDADFKIVKIKSIFENLPEIVYISKKPMWNRYHHYVAKEGKKYGDLFISGDGADELFGGYTFRYNKFLMLSQKKYDWKSKVKNYLECHNRDWVPDQKEIFGKSIKFDWKKIHQHFKLYFSNNLQPIKQVMLADYNGKLLYDFIPAGQTISKHYKLEKFPIFLNPRLTKFALGLPISQKYDENSNKGKLILRRISKRMGVEHIDEKRGFSPDLLIDWQKKGKKITESFLLDRESYIYKKNIINPSWIRKAIDIVTDDGDIRYLNRLISILALEVWYRIFVTKQLDPLSKLK